MKEFRNSYAHHSTLDLNHIREWKTQLQDFLSKSSSEEEVKLANGALSILNEILRFFSDSQNLKLAQYHRSKANEQNFLNPKSCSLGLDKDISKTHLKKIIKSQPKTSTCCGQVDVCIQKALVKMKSKGSKLAPSLERKILTRKSKQIVNPGNPYQDRNFNAAKVLKSPKFLREFSNSNENDSDSDSDSD